MSDVGALSELSDCRTVGLSGWRRRSMRAAGETAEAMMGQAAPMRLGKPTGAAGKRIVVTAELAEALETKAEVWQRRRRSGHAVRAGIREQPQQQRPSHGPSSWCGKCYVTRTPRYTLDMAPSLARRCAGS